MHAEYAIIAVGTIAVGLNLYVTRFHEGITANFSTKSTVLVTLEVALLIWALRRVPKIDRLLRVLERGQKE